MINPTRLLICWQYFARFLIFQANKLAITWNININIYLFILTSQSSNKVPYYMKFSRQLNFWRAYCFVTLKILEFFLTFLETNKETSLFSTSNFGVFKKNIAKNEIFIQRSLQAQQSSSQTCGVASRWKNISSWSGFTFKRLNG